MNKKVRGFICMVLALSIGAGVMTGCSKSTKNTTPKPTTTTLVASTRKLEQQGTVGDIEYRVLSQDEYGNLMTRQRGYYVDTLDEPNAPYFIVICSGSRNTGGYDIKIIDLAIEENDILAIYVEETAPSPDMMVTEAITYPYCVLEVNKMPKGLRITNQIGDEFLPYDEVIYEDTVYDVEPSIPDGYIAVLNGGGGEITYETYVYRTDRGFEYVNVTSTTESWGSPVWNKVVDNSGTASTKEEIIEVAEEHGATQFVLFAGDDDPHPLSGFLEADI